MGISFAFFPSAALSLKNVQLHSCICAPLHFFALTLLKEKILAYFERDLYGH